MPKLNEYEKAIRLYERIQRTPFHARKKKFGRRWPVVANDVWFFAEECGVPEEEVSHRMSSIDQPTSVDNLVVVTP